MSALQDYLAILIAVAAAAFLAYRGWQTVAKRKAGCGACSSCPASSSNTPADLVTISPILSHAKAQRREEQNNS